MQHSASSALDNYDFDVASQEVLEACSSLSRSPRRLQRANSAPADTFRFADLKSQDPAAFAHLLADHFVAKEAAVASPRAPAKPQQLARPAAAAVGLGSFRSWQFGERCLATYRVLFGRPLWKASASTTAPPPSPRPRKRKHVTPPSSCSSDEAGQMRVLQLDESAEDGELLSLSTVDELLELQADDVLEDGKTETLEASDDVLADLVVALGGELGPDAAAGADSIDLLWDLDASDVDGGAMLTEGEEEELRFLAAAPSTFSPDDEMEGV
jgi:hypothetical protein